MILHFQQGLCSAWMRHERSHLFRSVPSCHVLGVPLELSPPLDFLPKLLLFLLLLDML